MPDENPNEQPSREYDAMEREAVYLLTDPDHHPPIWSLADLGRELETRDPMAVIRPLLNAGLLHRTGDCVFATPAAYKMVGLIGQVV
jgi:hypothetical protein